MPNVQHVPIPMKTRRTRAVVSPCLRDAADITPRSTSPSLGAGATTLIDDAPAGFFRPVASIQSRSLDAVCTGAVSPSLGARGAFTGSPSLCPSGATGGASTGAVAPVPTRTTPGPGGVSMTTAVCKRASRMARPAEPSQAAMTAAASIVNARENELRERGLERLASMSGERFKFVGAATGKGPAVKADTGDAEADVAAQAKMNHVRAALAFACNH